MIRSGVSKVFILGKDVVDKCRSASPMAKNEQGIVLHRLVGQQFLVFPFLERNTCTQDSADDFRQEEFRLFLWCDVLPFRDGLESVPIGSNQRVHRELTEFY